MALPPTGETTRQQKQRKPGAEGAEAQQKLLKRRVAEAAPGLCVDGDAPDKILKRGLL